MGESYLHVSYDDFMDLFLLKPAGLADRTYAGAFDAMPDDGARTDEIFYRFCECLERAGLCPGYTCARTPDSSRGQLDAGLVPAAFVPGDGHSRQFWANHALSLVFQRAGRDGPFDEPDSDSDLDSETDSETDADAARKERARAQLATHAARVFASQQRTFCLAALVRGAHARLVRWDHAGAVVTDRIDLKAHPEFFGEFLWRFAHLPRALQGFDPTAALVAEDSQEHALMLQVARTELPAMDYVRKYFANSLNERWPWWKLRVDEADKTPWGEDDQGSEAEPDPANDTHARPIVPQAPTTRFRYYLVGKPHFLADGVIGRGTRGYVALDCESHTLVFLKDVWRSDRADMQKEGAVLQRLNGHGVQNVPTLLCHGDVDEQRTLTQVVWCMLYDCPQDECPLKQHAHYRCVVKEVGLPLRDFRSGHELVKVVHDCLVAHQQAYERLRLLHRDVSSGNVLIVERLVDGETVRIGYLIDWELSAEILECSSLQPLRNANRPGTWQFLSALSLQNPYKPIVLQDDLESFFHLVLYEAIRFLPHNVPDASVGPFILDYFDAATPHKEYMVCGRYKWYTIKSGVLDSNGLAIQFGHNRKYPLNSLLHTLLTWFKAYYAVVLRDHSEALHGPDDVDARDAEDFDTSRPSSAGDIQDDPQEQHIPDLDSNGESSNFSEDEDLQAEAARMQKSREHAQRLSDHRGICALFSKTLLNTKSWVDNDKVPDKLPRHHHEEAGSAEDGGSISTAGKHTLGGADVARPSKKARLTAMDGAQAGASIGTYLSPQGPSDSASARKGSPYRTEHILPLTARTPPRNLDRRARTPGIAGTHAL